MSREEVQNDIQYPIQNERLDLVSVVRCKDCRHYTTASNGCNGMCDIQLTMVMYPWDYCSYGEKRDG